MMYRRKQNLFVKIAVLCIVLVCTILPVAAYTLSDVNLVSENRPYDSDNPAKHITSDKFKIPMNGKLVVTFKIDPYYPYTKDWGRVGGSPFFLGPVVESTSTPKQAIANQPYEERTVYAINTDQGDNLFAATLTAPVQCVSMQNCYEGTQFAAKQEMKFEFDPDSETPPSDCSWTGSWSGAPQYFGEPVVLTQSGNSVTGTYPLNGGSIDGTISGNVLSGTWHEGSKSGPIELTMKSDCSVSGRVSGSNGGEMSYPFGFTRS